MLGDYRVQGLCVFTEPRVCLTQHLHGQPVCVCMCECVCDIEGEVEIGKWVESEDPTHLGDTPP